MTVKISVINANSLTPDHMSVWSKIQRSDRSLQHPFLSPQFTRVAAAVRDDVEVGILTEGGDEVGFFPFERNGRVGRAVVSRVSERHGVIVDKGVDWSAELLLRGCGLSAFRFDHLVASQEAFAPYHVSLDDAPYIDLREGYDQYCAYLARRTSLLAQTARKSRKLEREVGPLRFDLHTTSRRVFDALVDWKRHQLRRTDCLEVFRALWVIALLELIRVAETRELAGLLSALWAGDQLVAVHLGVRSHEVVSSWIPAYDVKYGSYSPGVILHLELARACAAHGVTHIDLGRGSNRMKTSLMSGAVPLAIGTIECRRVHREFTRGWYLAQRLGQSALLRGGPLRTYRRARNWAATVRGSLPGISRTTGGLG